MKIIDVDRKGNLVRFYLGADDCDDYWGDDWDDAPYEHNAGTVYDRFVTGVRDVAFAFDAYVLEPCNGVDNSSFSKEDMIKRRVPCLIVVPPELTKESFNDWNFYYWLGNAGVRKYYFGDEWNEKSV